MESGEKHELGFLIVAIWWRGLLGNSDHLVMSRPMRFEQFFRWLPRLFGRDVGLIRQPGFMLGCGVSGFGVAWSE